MLRQDFIQQKNLQVSNVSITCWHPWTRRIKLLVKFQEPITTVTNFSEDKLSLCGLSFLGSVNDAVAKEDAGGYESLLTAYSVLGLVTFRNILQVNTLKDWFPMDVTAKENESQIWRFLRRLKWKIEFPARRKDKKEIERMKIAVN
jgi:hypothetical protein